MSKNSGENKNFDGVQSAAEMLNLLDKPNRDRILNGIEAQDPTLASKIREQMFVFDDLERLDGPGIQMLLKEVPRNYLILSLRSVSDSFKENFFKNMSKRAAELMKEEIEALGPQKLSSVKIAQQEVTKIALKLMGQGRLTLGRR